MLDNIDITKDLNEYENIFKKAEELAVKLYKDKKYSDEMIYVKKNLEAAKRNIENYKIKNKILQEILNTVKIGDTVAQAVPKLSNMTKKTKYYDVKTRKYSGNYFNYYSEKEIIKEIEEHGYLELHGNIDLYVMFNDNKVKNVYYKKIKKVYF